MNAPLDDRGLSHHAEQAGERIASRLAVGFAILMHLMVGVFYLSSSLVAPSYAVLPLWAIWLALAFLLWRERRRVAVVLSIPFIAAFVWGGVMWLGDRLLGWTA